LRTLYLYYNSFYYFSHLSSKLEQLDYTSSGYVFFTTVSCLYGETRAVTVLAEAMMLWATITEGLHRSFNIHHDLNAECATAKTGLFGGAGFLALDAALFWLVCQMLTDNARADYLEDEDPKGTYGQVLATDYDVNGAGRTAPIV